MIRRILALFSLLCLAAAVAAQQDAATAERNLDRVREQIEGLEAQIRRTTASRSASEAALREAEVAAGRAARRLEALVAERARATQRLDELRAAEAGQRDRLAGQQGLLAEQLQAAWISGREEWLRLLLSQEDPAAAGRQLVYYTYITRQRSELIGTVRETLAALGQTVAEVADEQERLTELEAEQQQKLASLEAARRDRSQALDRLDKELSGRQGEVAKLREQATALEQLVEELRLALADLNLDAGAAFAAARGKLRWPARGPVLHSFGQPRADGRLRWQGTLLGAPAGSEVHAVHHGRVVFADWLNGMGLLLVLEHGDGFMTLYGHNQDLVRDVGDWVGPGDLLGHVGDSGGQAEAGLYFEIRRNGEPVNPKPWMGK